MDRSRVGLKLCYRIVLGIIVRFEVCEFVSIDVYGYVIVRFLGGFLGRYNCFRIFWSGVRGELEDCFRDCNWV